MKQTIVKCPHCGAISLADMRPCHELQWFKCETRGEGCGEKFLVRVEQDAPVVTGVFKVVQVVEAQGGASS